VADIAGKTALMAAAAAGQLEAMKVLMLAKASPGVPDAFGDTALFYCLRASHWVNRKAMIRLLCLNGANINHVNNSGVS
jgi:ankyrin repeat protein